MYKQCAEEKMSFLVLNSLFPDSLDGVPSERITLGSSAIGENYRNYVYMTYGNEIKWLIAGVPNTTWAKKVFPDLTEEEALIKLWNAIFDSVLVSGDGNAEEKLGEHIDELNSTSSKLTELNLKTLHYTNSMGTDFTIDLPETAIWRNAETTTQDGEKFIANLPSEEVFTAPIANSANGVVYASLPLVLNDTVIDGLYFKLENGKIIESYAKSGEEILNAELDKDEGARFLGELSLVSYDSPISKSGVLFYDTLYDENASCHLAFGLALAECIEGGTEMSGDELVEAGLNTSNVHVDFMIGTADLKIVGTTYDDEEIVIFENGNFIEYFN